MKKLPVIRWKTAAPRQTERLQRWVKEREMGLQVAQEQGPQEPVLRTGPRVPGPLDELIAPFDRTPPKPGEIRLLSAWLLPEARRPVYVLVLADWEDDIKLIAPFGALTEPATPGELRTRRDDLALSVLCLWNVHSVPDSRLAQSWIVDRLGEAELAEAWAVFRHAATGAPLDASLEARVGIPILDESDPRITYQAAEAALMSPLAEAVRVEVDPSVIVFLPSLTRQLQSENLALAAEEGASAEAVECFEIPSKKILLKVHLERDHRNATLFVHDASGEPSTILDGADVVDRNGRPLARIGGSFASFPFAVATLGIGVRLSSGESLHLERS